MTATLAVARNEGLGLAIAANDSAQPFFSEYAINSREVIRAEVCTINGRQVVRLSRWKLTPAGNKRTGCAFEFGAQRCKAVAGLLADIERELGGLADATT